VLELLVRAPPEPPDPAPPPAPPAPVVALLLLVASPLPLLLEALLLATALLPPLLDELPVATTHAWLDGSQTSPAGHAVVLPGRHTPEPSHSDAAVAVAPLHEPATQVVPAA